MSDEKALPSCPFCATVVAPYGKGWVCPNEECEFVQPMTLDGISRRTPAPAREDLARLRFIRGKLADLRSETNSRARAEILDQIWAETAKAEYETPPPPSKSEDEIRAEDFITKTLELLDEGHDTDETGVCFRRCGGCKREEELREMAKSLRSGKARGGK